MKKKIISIGIISIFLLTGFTTISAATIRTATRDMVIDSVQSVDVSSTDGNIAKWTVIAYLDGDNLGMYDHAHTIVGWLEEVGSTDDVEVVAQTDIEGGPARRYHVKCRSSEVIAELGEINMGDPQTLSDFVCWAVDNYPAEHYLLNLFDHGGGWYGVCWDDTTGIPGLSEDWLTLDDLKLALSDISQHLKEKDPYKEKIDIILFDACLMSNIEMYYSIKDYVEYGIGSVAVCGAVWSDAYQAILETLNQNLDWTVEQIAIELGKICERYLVDSTAVYVDRIAALVEKTDILAEKLTKHLSKYKSNIETAIKWSSPYLGPTGSYTLVDLWYFAVNIKIRIPEGEIKSAAQAVIEAVDNAVGSEGIGLTIQIDKGIDKDRFDIYLDLDFSKDTSWDDFLCALYPEPMKLVKIYYPKDGQIILYDDRIYCYAAKVVETVELYINGEHITTTHNSNSYILWSWDREYRKRGRNVIKVVGYDNEGGIIDSDEIGVIILAKSRERIPSEKRVITNPIIQTMHRVLEKFIDFFPLLERLLPLIFN